MEQKGTQLKIRKRMWTWASCSILLILVMPRMCRVPWMSPLTLFPPVQNDLPFQRRWSTSESEVVEVEQKGTEETEKYNNV